LIYFPLSSSHHFAPLARMGGFDASSSTVKPTPCYDSTVYLSNYRYCATIHLFTSPIGFLIDLSRRSLSSSVPSAHMFSYERSSVLRSLPFLLRSWLSIHQTSSIHLLHFIRLLRHRISEFRPQTARTKANRDLEIPEIPMHHSPTSS